MKPNTKKLLLPFYFGSIEHEDRLSVERDLLTDTEVLVDYLDLKRKIEAAEEIPSAPSLKIWHRLQAQMPSQRTLLKFSLGAAAIACLILLSVIYFRPISDNPDGSSHKSFLFDSNSELSANSHVL